MDSWPSSVTANVPSQAASVENAVHIESVDQRHPCHGSRVAGDEGRDRIEILAVGLNGVGRWPHRGIGRLDDGAVVGGAKVTDDGAQQLIGAQAGLQPVG